MNTKLAILCLSALLLLASAIAQAQEPAAEYFALLDMRFYSQNGGFLVERLQMVFPPSADRPIELVVSKASGERVATVPLRLEAWERFPVFAGLLPKGHPGNVQVGQPGE